MSKLKEYCLNITDGEHGCVTFSSDGEYFFLNNNNIREEGIVINTSDKKISRDEFERINRRVQLEHGDLVIATCGTLGKTYVLPPGNINYVFSRSVGIIKCNETKLLPYYLHYYFSNPSVQKKIQIMAKGGVQKHFYIGDMMNFDVDFHNIQKQHQIVNVLRCIDEKIAVNRRITSELEIFAKLIYDYWFLQFEFPNEEGKPYKSSGGKMVWNEELGREIPEGWSVERLGNHITVTRGISYTSSDLCGEGIPLINLDSFNPDFTYKVEGIKTYSGKYTPHKILSPGDLLVAVTQQTSIDLVRDIDVIGKGIHLPDIFSKDSTFTMDVIKIETDSTLNTHYLSMLFKQKFYRKYITRFANGTKIKHLDINGILDFQYLIPTKHVLDSFALVSATYERTQSALMRENQELASLRDWLLPLLMNGQVGFREAEDGQ